MPSRALRKLFNTRSNHHRDASYVFVILLMFGVMAFLVLIIDNVIVVSVIGSASAVIWHVNVVTAVTV